MEEAEDIVPAFVNNSGEGASAVVPPQAKGLNWGAFFLTWIWGIGNNTSIALLSVVPVIGTVMAIILLFKGNEWAWRNKKWDSVAQFHRTQKMWGGVGLIACGVLPAIIISCCWAMVGVMVGSMLGDSPPAQLAVQCAQKNAAAVTVLGSPIKLDGIVGGKIDDKDGTMLIDIQVPVSGSKRAGKIDMTGTFNAGNYTLSKFELAPAGDAPHIRLSLP